MFELNKSTTEYQSDPNQAASDPQPASFKDQSLKGYLNPWFSDPRSKFMQNGLKNALRKTLLGQRTAGSSAHETQPLEGFSFNEAFKINQCLHFPLSIHQVAA